MNRRTQIALSAEERTVYVAAAPTIILCTQGRDGYPHAVAMWFTVDDDGTIWMTTYRKSQKAVNIRHNAKVALHVESGVTYETLKGVLICGDAELIDDADLVFRIFRRIHEKMSGSFPDGVEDVLRHQAQKRVVLRVTPKRVSSWDHAKLSGVY